MKGILACAACLLLTLPATAQTAPETQSKADALYKVIKKAEQGDIHSQKFLGDLYYYDSDLSKFYGVAQNYVQSAYWYRKAAEQGDASGEENLCALYHNGQGVPQDDTQAVYWCRKSAEQGWDFGLEDLGDDYEEGRGVPQDAVIAYALYNLSATNYAVGRPGTEMNPPATDRARVASHMTERQIEDGQRLTLRMQSMGVTEAIQAFSTP